jgi:hypothetical protein
MIRRLGREAQQVLFGMDKEDAYRRQITKGHTYDQQHA